MFTLCQRGVLCEEGTGASRARDVRIVYVVGCMAASRGGEEKGVESWRYKPAGVVRIAPREAVQRGDTVSGGTEGDNVTFARAGDGMTAAGRIEVVWVERYSQPSPLQSEARGVR